MSVAKAAPDANAGDDGPTWVVQLASYAREADARAFAKKLRAKGYTPTIGAGDSAGQPRYRVEIGPLASRAQAAALQKELAELHQLDQTLLLLRSPSTIARSR
jgi:cell division septation protein DedD